MLILDRFLPITGKITPRIASFAAVIRTELLAAQGRLDDAVAMLRFGDTNGLVDLLWLENCPLLAELRGRPDVAPILSSVRLRASRVAAMLDG
jgi:serine/threonine-protein kinase